MKRASIKKNDITTHQAEMEEAQLNEWILKHESMGTFGHKDIYEKQPVVISEAVYEDQNLLIQEEITEEQEILDENEESFDPPQFETVVIQEAIYEIQPVLISPVVYEMEQVEIGIDEEENPIYEERIKLVDVLVAPQNYEVIIEDVTDEVIKRDLVLEKRAKGKAAAEACNAVLELVGGFNIDRELTFEQKNEMKVLFAEANEALKERQPGYAKYFINSLVPDGILLTQEMKDLCIELLANH